MTIAKWIFGLVQVSMTCEIFQGMSGWRQGINYTVGSSIAWILMAGSQAGWWGCEGNPYPWWEWYF